MAAADCLAASPLGADQDTCRAANTLNAWSPKLQLLTKPRSRVQAPLRAAGTPRCHPRPPPRPLALHAPQPPAHGHAQMSIEFDSIPETEQGSCSACGEACTPQGRTHGVPARSSAHLRLLQLMLNAPGCPCSPSPNLHDHRRAPTTDNNVQTVPITGLSKRMPCTRHGHHPGKQHALVRRNLHSSKFLQQPL